MAGVVSHVQLRQLEMQLEQEYEEKQTVLHEKQDLEGLIGTLCEQVRGQCPPRGQPGRAASGDNCAPLSLLLPPGQPPPWLAVPQLSSQPVTKRVQCPCVDGAPAW